MNAGIGAAHTVPEHREWADQLYAIYARGREARLMAAIVGEAGLSPGDRRALAFAERFERTFVGQGNAATHASPRPSTPAGGCSIGCRPTICSSSTPRCSPVASSSARDARRRRHDARTTPAPATRSSLLRSARRLDQVRRGAALLKRKRQSLVEELFARARTAVTSREAIDAQARRAWRSLWIALVRERQ